MPIQDRHQEIHEQKKEEIMVKAYDCFAEYGLRDTGIRKVAEYCGINPAVIYSYFENLDDLITRSTEFVMSHVEDDFMARAPKSAAEISAFLDETPHWTAETHGKKYRLMYQVYTHPKFREAGQKFFEGVNRRYSEYAEELSGRLGIPATELRPMIFIYVRACVHYALYEDEFYLDEQIRFLKQVVKQSLLHR